MAELKYLCLAHWSHSDQAHQEMAAVKKKENNRCWQECRELGIHVSGRNVK